MIRAQGLAIQAKDELIRQLQQQLQEETTISVPSSNPSKKPRRRQEEDADFKKRLNEKVKQAVQRNLELVGLARGWPSAYDNDSLGGSPFSREIRDSPLPEDFRIPRFVLYDCTSDPAAHFRHFTQRMSVWGSAGHLYCRLFSSSLGDLPLKWFCAFPRRSITSWQQLQSSFMTKFQAYRVIPRSDADPMARRMEQTENITQTENIATPFLAGLAVAAVAFAGRYGVQAWQAFKTRPVVPCFRKFYEGGFQPMMTRREAALILGIRENVAADKVKEAHRKVMVANHPDAGGSHYLASKINEAKEVILGKAKGGGSAF